MILTAIFTVEASKGISFSLTLPPSNSTCRSGDNMGWWQFRGGCSCSPPARTPVWPLRQLQWPQARWYDGRRWPVQVWRRWVCWVLASWCKWGLLPATSASPADIVPVPRQCQSQVPRPSWVPEDKVMGVSEVPPCGRLCTFLQVIEGSRTEFDVMINGLIFIVKVCYSVTVTAHHTTDLKLSETLPSVGHVWQICASVQCIKTATASPSSPTAEPAREREYPSSGGPTPPAWVSDPKAISPETNSQRQDVI